MAHVPQITRLTSMAIPGAFRQVVKPACIELTSKFDGDIPLTSKFDGDIPLTSSWETCN